MRSGRMETPRSSSARPPRSASRSRPNRSTSTRSCAARARTGSRPRAPSTLITRNCFGGASGPREPGGDRRPNLGPTDHPWRADAARRKRDAESRARRAAQSQFQPWPARTKPSSARMETWRRAQRRSFAATLPSAASTSRSCAIGRVSARRRLWPKSLPLATPFLIAAHRCQARSKRRRRDFRDAISS